jgi:tetratricopeptide (TPR) repeat protein
MSEDCLRTFRLLTLFAAAFFHMSASAAPGSAEYADARRWMAEAKQTTNPVRLLMLSVRIREALQTARAKEPDNVDVLLDLVRFYTVTPRIAGGGIDDARAEAAEIARRDAALGSFARGYIDYHEKDFGIARIELREAMKSGNAATRALAARWLGWLSQESQQWDDAFAIFEELRATDPSALYEIGRTAMFCSCRLERGRAAVREYLKVKPAREMPTAEDARKVLKKLR